jgi:hypothetical protein
MTLTRRGTTPAIPVAPRGSGPVVDIAGKPTFARHNKWLRKPSLWPHVEYVANVRSTIGGMRQRVNQRDADRRSPYHFLSLEYP